ncbi:MAG: hypothetical protein QOJ91_3095 [Sphingomonadales bacterium]|nr:hypothetical protein [Sphingomonadales bacterium]
MGRGAQLAAGDRLDSAFLGKDRLKLGDSALIRGDTERRRRGSMNRGPQLGELLSICPARRVRGGTRKAANAPSVGFAVGYRPGKGGRSAVKATRLNPARWASQTALPKHLYGISTPPSIRALADALARDRRAAEKGALFEGSSKSWPPRLARHVAGGRKDSRISTASGARCAERGEAQAAIRAMAKAAMTWRRIRRR